MKVKMVSRKLEADAGDFHLSKFTTFKSSQGYTGDFGNQYAMVIYDKAPGQNNHRFLNYDWQIVQGEPVWYIASPVIS